VFDVLFYVESDSIRVFTNGFCQADELTVLFVYSSPAPVGVGNEEAVKPRSLRFTWSMKTTSSRDPNEIMAEIRKVNFKLIYNETSKFNFIIFKLFNRSNYEL